jgi:hypothetical protein
MPDTSVAAYVTQARDILGDLPSQLTSDDIITVNNLVYPTKLVLTEFAGFGTLFYLCLFQNHFRCMLTYTMDIG